MKSTQLGSSIAVLLLIALAACRDGQLVPQPSPNKAYVLKPSIDAMIVKATIVRATDGGVVGTIDTRASDVMAWAMGWYDDETIVLDSSDIGVYAWRYDGALWNQIRVDGAMCRHARDLSAAKYQEDADYKWCLDR
jgi:hypothetical protein